MLLIILNYSLAILYCCVFIFNGGIISTIPHNFGRNINDEYISCIVHVASY